MLCNVFPRTKAEGGSWDLGMVVDENWRWKGIHSVNFFDLLLSMYLFTRWLAYPSYIWVSFVMFKFIVKYCRSGVFLIVSCCFSSRADSMYSFMFVAELRLGIRSLSLGKGIKLWTILAWLKFKLPPNLYGMLIRVIIPAQYLFTSSMRKFGFSYSSIFSMH